MAYSIFMIPSFVILSVAEARLCKSLQFIDINWATMICPDEDYPLDLILINHPHKCEYKPFVKCLCFPFKDQDSYLSSSHETPHTENALLKP